MSSQLNVDTIVDKAGSGGTNVKIGNTSTYVADGGSATQNAVQGMLKCWSTVEMDNSNNIPDSFNSSGITDNGSGTPEFTFINSMSTAASYVFAGSGHDGTFINEHAASGDDRSTHMLTGSLKTRARGHDGGVTDGHHIIMVAGDLA